MENLNNTSTTTAAAQVLHGRIVVTGAAAGAALLVAAGIGFAAGFGAGWTGKRASNAATTPAAAAVSNSSAPAGFALNGRLTLQAGAFQWNHAADGSTPCTGYSGYADITAGAPVVIADQGGTIIATGQLVTGSATVDTTIGRATTCTFTFTVPHVPDRPFYGVAVSHRGTVTYSAEQAKSGQVGLTLG